MTETSISREDKLQMVKAAAQLMAAEFNRLGFYHVPVGSFDREPCRPRISNLPFGVSAYFEATRGEWGEPGYLHIKARLSDHDCGPGRWNDYHFTAVITRPGEADESIRAFIARIETIIKEG